jgi:tetratricopeptide (TPR) repeat protein
MKRSQGLMLLSLLSALLLLSQCAGRKPAPSVHALKPEESAKLTEAYNPRDPRQPDRRDLQTLPSDRLEALGEAALQSRDYETSLYNFLEILQQNPARHDIRYKVGVLFLLTGQLAPAQRELAMVLVQRPEMLEAHEALGLVHLQEKRYLLAIEEFRLVLGKDPRRPKTTHLLGISFLEAGQPDRAITELKKAAELDPRNIATFVGLGQAYLNRKDYQQALNYLKKGQGLDPKNQKINYHLGMALAGLKRYSEALEAFRKSGDEAQAYNNIGVHLFLDGQYEEAAKCFQRALDLRPTFYQEAQTNLQKALEKLHESRKDPG